MTRFALVAIQSSALVGYQSDIVLIALSLKSVNIEILTDKVHNTLLVLHVCVLANCAER